MKSIPPMPNGCLALGKRENSVTGRRLNPLPNLESNRMGYKRELDKNDKFEKAAVLFLNYYGGSEILNGTAGDGALHGVSGLNGDQRPLYH